MECIIAEIIFKNDDKKKMITTTKFKTNVECIFAEVKKKEK